MEKATKETLTILGIGAIIYLLWAKFIAPHNWFGNKPGVEDMTITPQTPIQPNINKRWPLKVI